MAARLFVQPLENKANIVKKNKIKKEKKKEKKRKEEYESTEELKLQA